MSLSESQLDTWSKQGAVTSAKRTHRSVRTAIDEYGLPDKYKKDIYLQGSYKNDTNIRGDSDVDIIIELNSIFLPELSNLSSSEKREYNEYHRDATHNLSEFKNKVINALNEYYGSSSVSVNNKCIEVDTPHLVGDVVVCQLYRLFHSFSRSDPYSNCVEGIVFWAEESGRKIINFPKPHFENGKIKHSSTDSNYKPLVRCYKNARTYLVEEGVISGDLAPSYFLECMLYNVPDPAYKSNYKDSFYDILGWLSNADLNEFVCQNKQHSLFGDTPEQWSRSSARQLIRSLQAL